MKWVVSVFQQKERNENQPLLDFVFVSLFDLWLDEVAEEET